MEKVQIIAHRGASREAPENTLAAFELALRQGSDAIELDVRFTADSELAVIHDPTTKRTAGLRAKVAERTLAELQELDAGSWFDRRFGDQRIPSLEQVCRILRGSRADLLVEIKAESGVPEGFADILLDKLSRQEMLSRAILQSFDHGLLMELRRRDAHVRLAALFDRATDDPVQETARAGAGIIAIRRNLVRERLVAEARERGMEVFAWTVDRAGQIRKVLSQGVHGLITNRPQRALQIRESMLGTGSDGRNASP